MGSIEELKRALADHADVPDEGLADRPGAVAGRVQVVRRRRRAAVAGAAVAVVAVAGAVTLLPSQQDEPPVAATVFGVDVPETMVSLGRTYRFSHTVEGESGTATLPVEETKEPRLVSWATRGEDQRVTVERPRSLGDDGTFVSERPDFTDFVVAHSHDAVGSEEETPPQVVVTGSGEPVALAIYEPTDEVAAGHTEHGVTFRQEVADRRLVTAEVGERGDAEIELTFTAGDGRYALANWCTSSWRGAGRITALASLTMNGEDVLARGCSSPDGPPDPGAEATSFEGGGLPLDVRPGDEVTLALRLTGGEGSTALLDDAAAQLGLGVYELTDTGLELDGPLAGTSVPKVVEHDGHLWRLATVQPGSIAPGATLMITAPPSDDRLLVGFHVGNLSGTPSVELSIDGRPGAAVEYAASEGGSALGGIATPETSRIRLRARGGGADAAIVVYGLVG